MCSCMLCHLKERPAKFGHLLKFQWLIFPRSDQALRIWLMLTKILCMTEVDPEWWFIYHILSLKAICLPAFFFFLNLNYCFTFNHEVLSNRILKSQWDIPRLDWLSQRNITKQGSHSQRARHVLTHFLSLSHTYTESYTRKQKSTGNMSMPHKYTDTHT